MWYKMLLLAKDIPIPVTMYKRFAVWNFTLIANIFDFVPEGGEFTNALVTVSLPTDNIFITGGEFGIEASAFGIIAYLVVCMILMQNNKALRY